VNVKKDNRNILISSVASPTGQNLAHFFSSMDYKLFGIDAIFSQFKFGTFSLCPNASYGIEFSEFLLSLVESHKVSKIFLCNDLELNAIAKNWKDEELVAQGLPVAKSIELFQDKKISGDIATEYGFSKIPEVSPDENINVDLYIKNRFSFARPKTNIESKFIPKNDNKILLIQEKINGLEFTADTFYSKKQDLIKVMIRRRLGIIGGISTQAEFYELTNVRLGIERMVRDFGLEGFGSVQFIKRNNKFFFLEMNTRPGGGLKLSLNSGMFPDPSDIHFCK
jgi:carbamoyl-phosphate synthase large subunit